MNVHLHNIGECQKCSMVFTSLFTSKLKPKININLTDDPKECDLLVIMGCLTRKQLKPLKEFWKNMPKEHRVLLIGDCGTENQGLFTFDKDLKLKNQAILKDDLTEIMPIDYNINGCPPKLSDIIEFFNKLK